VGYRKRPGWLFIENLHRNSTHDHENKMLSIGIMLYAGFHGLFKMDDMSAERRLWELFPVPPCWRLFHIDARASLCTASALYTPQGSHESPIVK
jgi:hypothetical protein